MRWYYSANKAPIRKRNRALLRVTPLFIIPCQFPFEKQTPCALRVDLPSRQESGACLLSRKAALTFCAAWCEE